MLNVVYVFNRPDFNSAAQTLRSAKEIIDEYGCISLADIRELCGEPSNYTDSKIGWTSKAFINTEIKQRKSGCYICIPQCDWYEEESNVQKIFTRDEAAQIVEMFESVLDLYNIEVPSPEDDEREPDNKVGLYGSTYYDLLDDVESCIVTLLEKHVPDVEIITNTFSGGEI